MISTREIAAEYRLGHWAQVLQERMQSGMSVKAYCKQMGICENTYFYWQRIVHVAAATGLELCDCNKSTPITRFREVQLVEKAASPAVAEEHSPSQLYISVGEMQLAEDSRYPVGQLAELLQALSRPC